MRLPSPQSDLAQQALKDPYLFDFLTLDTDFLERELETGHHLTAKDLCPLYRRRLSPIAYRL